MAQGSFRRRQAVENPRCEDCYFRRNMLCALDLDEPCATFRPDRPEGLVPPRQPVLLMRAPRWAGLDPTQPRRPTAPATAGRRPAELALHG